MKFAENSGYKVVITHDAKANLAQILHYLRQDLENEQAAQSVRDDMLETKIRLSHIAGSLKLCENPHLRDLGYRTIHLKRHNYFMLYKIIDNIVRVDGIYHDLQDYESFFK